MMHALSVLTTVVIACSGSTLLAAIVPIRSKSASSAAGTRLLSPTATLNALNVTTSYVWPWPKAPWIYTIPGHSPQHLLFEEISPKDTFLEGQQTTLHTCDEIIRWLWANYKAGQVVDHACVQKSPFNGKIEGHVVMVLVPITIGDVIDRELALDSIRALENLVWRYGGHSLECEIWSGGKVKGRISITVTVSEPKSAVSSDTAAVRNIM